MPSSLQSTLTPKQAYAAFCVASGMTNEEAGKTAGYAASRISILKNQNESFIAKVDEFRKEIEERLLNNTNLVEMFNREAPRAFETLKELHSMAENENVRLGAARDILDRAPIAPKTIKVNEGNSAGGTFIQLSLKETENIMETLESVGEGDVIELLEGGDGEYAARMDREIEITKI